MKYFYIIFFVLIITLLLGFIYVYQLLYYPIQYPGQEIIFQIKPGDSFSKVAKQLEKKNIIKNSTQFSLLGRLTGHAQSIQAGEFKINTSWSRLKIMKMFSQGKVVLHKLQIPEGLTWWETAKLIERSGLSTFENIKATMHDQELLNKYNIPGKNAEGFLFPDTYLFPRTKNNEAKPIIEAMLQEFWKKAKREIWPNELPEPEKIRKVVVLASMVEKETSLQGEKKKIAGVFKNRLQKDMLLQCDPTVIYGLGPNFNGNLTKKDLRNKNNSYNTYIYKGLPPGPICSPGLTSLLAAQDPEKHDYYYFVAKEDGGHKFSRNLKEHNQAVQKYQIK